jgi:uncharacterized protein (UPF0303 family)
VSRENDVAEPSYADQLTELALQEERLVFSRFDNDDAWRLGARLVEAARAANLPVAISIRRNGQRLFHAGLPGSTPDNDAWLDRKSAVAARYCHSSYYVGTSFRARGRTFEEDSRLDPNLFAAHGGAFPINVRDVGCVATVAVSGLPQAEDHAFLVTHLESFLQTGG